MKKTLLSTIILFTMGSCNLFFDIRETRHEIYITNESSVEIDFVWSIEGNGGITTLVENGGSGPKTFLVQKGDKNQLDIGDMYRYFDELILYVDSDSLKEKVTLQSLQIKPQIYYDVILGFAEWGYTFTIDNEALNP